MALSLVEVLQANQWKFYINIGTIIKSRILDSQKSLDAVVR